MSSNVCQESYGIIFVHIDMHIYRNKCISLYQIFKHLSMYTVNIHVQWDETYNFENRLIE